MRSSIKGTSTIEIKILSILYAGNLEGLMWTSPNSRHVHLGYHAPGYNRQIRGAVESTPSLYSSAVEAGYLFKHQS
jgi:hypothetical protein